MEVESEGLPFAVIVCLGFYTWFVSGLGVSWVAAVIGSLLRLLIFSGFLAVQACCLLLYAAAGYVLLFLARLQPVGRGFLLLLLAGLLVPMPRALCFFGIFWFRFLMYMEYRCSAYIRHLCNFPLWSKFW